MLEGVISGLSHLNGSEHRQLITSNSGGFAPFYGNPGGRPMELSRNQGFNHEEQQVAEIVMDRRITKDFIT